MVRPVDPDVHHRAKRRPSFSYIGHLVGILVDCNRSYRFAQSPAITVRTSPRDVAASQNMVDSVPQRLQESQEGWNSPDQTSGLFLEPQTSGMQRHRDVCDCDLDEDL